MQSIGTKNFKILIIIIGKRIRTRKKIIIIVIGILDNKNGPAFQGCPCICN